MMFFSPPPAQAFSSDRSARTTQSASSSSRVTVISPCLNATRKCSCGLPLVFPSEAPEHGVVPASRERIQEFGRRISHCYSLLSLVPGVPGSWSGLGLRTMTAHAQVTGSRRLFRASKTGTWERLNGYPCVCSEAGAHRKAVTSSYERAVVAFVHRMEYSPLCTHGSDVDTQLTVAERPWKFTRQLVGLAARSQLVR